LISAFLAGWRERHQEGPYQEDAYATEDWRIAPAVATQYYLRLLFQERKCMVDNLCNLFKQDLSMQEFISWKYGK
jgi:hypothetical protein